MIQNAMKPMTFRGSQMSAIMGNIRRDLGEEAVILSTRRVGPNALEVVAGTSMAGSPGTSGRDGGLAEVLQTTGQLALKAIETSSHREPAKGRSAIASVLSAHGLSAQIGARLGALTSESDPPEIALTEGLSKLLKFDPRLPAEKKFVALVGPTGAGKTTTIAKLAARIQMALGLKMAFISMDSYRVGAGFQLQTYASLLRIPCRTLDPGKSLVEELEQARLAFSAHDLILMDTAGCSPRDLERISELGDLLGRARDTESLLVLPAAGNERDCLTTLQSFAPTGFKRVILSKLDETAYMGPVLNSLIRSDKALAFYATGQRVPEDIEPASARRLAWMLTTSVQ